MKHAKLFYVIGVSILISGLAVAGNVKSAGLKGLWSSPTTWIGGVLPGPADTVTIADGDTVTIDITNFTVAGIIVGEGGAPARLVFSPSQRVVMTIDGDLFVNSNAGFSVQTNTIGGNLVDTIFISGNITNLGNGFDLKKGTQGSTMTCANVIFIGSNDSYITMGMKIPYQYDNNNNSFNGITINKSGNARVILNSDVFLDAGTTGANPPTANAILTLKRGTVVTGPYAIVTLWGNDGAIVGGSDSSYVIGCLGRGMGNSSGATRFFPVGDSSGYRPVILRSVTGGGSTGHHVRVRVVNGQAALSTPSFTGDIDKVSDVRYYQATLYVWGSYRMDFAKFSLSYGSDDGVTAGNQNLRVAYSYDRINWVAAGPTATPHTTSFDVLPQTISSDSLTTPFTIDTTDAGKKVVYFALARVTGTTENSLTTTPTEVMVAQQPETFSLSQNYPNPFNPSTKFTYKVAKTGYVSVKIYNILGQEVATLVHEVKNPGVYTTEWNANGMTSGIYFCKMTSGSFSDIKKIVLMK